MKLLKDRRGEVSIHLALIMLVGLLLLAAALEVLHVYFVCNTVLEKTNEAVLAAAASNVADFYVGARESDGNARQYVNDYWASAVSVEEVEAALQGALGAERTEDGTLVREGGFRITGLQTVYQNALGTSLNFTTTLTVEVPLTLGGRVLPPVARELEVHTAYEAKF